MGYRKTHRLKGKNRKTKKYYNKIRGGGKKSAGKTSGKSTGKKSVDRVKSTASARHSMRNGEVKREKSGASAETGGFRELTPGFRELTPGFRELNHERSRAEHAGPQNQALQASVEEQRRLLQQRLNGLQP